MNIEEKYSYERKVDSRGIDIGGLSKKIFLNEEIKRISDKSSDIADCWLWEKALSKSGYGQIRSNGKTVYVHRLVYEMSNGPISDGMSICHRCDHPACFKPSHLFVGTHADNMRDCQEKKRHVFGERNGNAKLNRDKVIAIRKDYPQFSKKELARRYGVHRMAIHCVLINKTWSSV